MTRSPGQTVELCTLTRFLGEGGFGEVWQADRQGVRVAIKFLTLASREAQVRFDSEAQALHDVSHPNCTRLIANGALPDGTRFIVMEFVEGPTLSTWLESEHPEAAKLDVAMGIAHALAAIHSRGIVHRDLKPDNVIVSNRDGRWHPMLLDFGIAKLQGREYQDITKTGLAIGTPGFMSPEQLRGLKSISSATDMYAYGCLLYLLYAGQSPFAGESALAIGLSQLSGQSPALQAGPDYIRQMTASLLQSDPSRRPTAPAVLRAFATKSLRQQDSPVVSPTSDIKRPAMLAVALVAAVVVLLAIAISLMNETVPVPQPTALSSSASALLKSEDLGNQPPPVEDVGTDLSSPADPVDAADADAAPELPECARLVDYKPGYYDLGGTSVRLPEGYSRAQKHPVIVLYHDAHSERAIDVYALRGKVIDNNPRKYVVIVPQGLHPMTNSGHWAHAETMENAWKDVERAMKELCVDRERVVALGHGIGGRAAIDLACKDRAKALVLFGYRSPSGTGLKCMEEGAPPTLAVFPMQDPLSPPDGTAACGMPARLSVGRVSELLRELHKADGTPKTIKLGGTSCDQHSDNLTTCKIEGGVRWPNPKAQMAPIAALRVTGRGCEFGPRTKFPLTAEALRFFDSALESGQ